MSSKRVNGRIVAGGTFIAVVAGIVAVVNPAASADVMGVIQSAVSCATTTACVSGANTKAGPGVSGTSKTGTAITASGVAGLTATGTTGVGVAGTSNSSYGVSGTSNSNIGVKGVSNGYYGVSGTSNKAYGIAGSSGSAGKGGVFGSAAGRSAAGIYGTNSTSGYGVYGIVPGTGGIGVYGTSSDGSGIGVQGDAVGGSGVYGNTYSGTAVDGNSGGPGTAVLAQSVTGYGVSAFSDSGVAVEAQSGSSAAVSASTGGLVAIYGNAANGHGAEISGGKIGIVGRSDTTPLYLSTLNGSLVFFVDGAGNVHYHGNLIPFTSATNGGTVSAYSTKATQPTVEDTGTAQLAGGAAAVRLDPAFAASIDPGGGYRVFLTADGETRGSLYVAAKTPSGFLVRETQGGRSTVSFDYRIIAPALGQTGRRIAVTAGALPIGAPSAPVNALPTQPAPVPKLRSLAHP